MRRAGIYVNGNKISQARYKQLMTQGELANIVGVTRVAIAQMETKPERRFMPSNVRKVSEALGLSIDEVVKDK
jgi:DNA-binding XRE family transcriptional regulator